MLEQLSDEMLLEAYQSAIVLRLDKDFILLLFAEIDHRGLSNLSLPEEQLA